MTEQRKKALIKISAEHIIDVPSDWGEDEIDFWFNGSSHCISNDLLDCAEEHHRDDGTSSWLSIDYEYIREATEDDIMLLEGSRQLS
jgi:hypothetical protein